MKKQILVVLAALSTFIATAQVNVGLNLGFNKINSGDYLVESISSPDVGVRVGFAKNEKIRANVGLSYGLPASLNYDGSTLEGVKFSHINVQLHANYFVSGYMDEGFGLYIPFGVGINVGKFNIESGYEELYEGVDNPFTPLVEFGIGGNYVLDSGIGFNAEFIFGLPTNLQGEEDKFTGQQTTADTGAKLGRFLGLHLGVYKQF